MTLYRLTRPFPQHLLRSNDIPSDSEAVEIQKILTEDDALLSSQHLNHQARRHILQHIHQGRGILSVVRRLPLDILGEVFMGLREDSKVIWLLGRVCKRWRTATLSIPALWSNIQSRLSLAVIAAHLQKSQSSSLSIHLGPFAMAALELLVPRSERWESVELLVGSGGFNLILEQIHGKIPLLRRVDYRDLVVRPEPCRAFEIAPRLSEASLMGLMPLVLPWAQIQRAFLGLDDIDANLNQLQSATSLVELKLMTNAGRPSPSFAPIQLPRLRKLFTNNTQLLGALVCPSLEDLFLHDDAPSALVIPFLEQSACRLRMLTTRTRAASDIQSILTHVPTLWELRLTGKCAVDQLALKLTIWPDDQISRPLAPELRALTLNGMKTSRDFMAVVGMMASRLKSDLCPTLSLCAFNCNKVILNAHGSYLLSQFHDEGLKVEWLEEDDSKLRYHSWQHEYPS